MFPVPLLQVPGGFVARQPARLLGGAASVVKERCVAVAGQSERTILIGTVLLGTAVSGVTGFVLAQYFSVDVLSSLLYHPYDCMVDWGMNVGRHCFSDYTIEVSYGLEANPWAPYPLYLPPDFKPAHNIYPAGAMVPEMIFGILGKWLAAPKLGLLGYLLVLTMAVLSPAVWAARSARGLERALVFAACGIAAVPAWLVTDRGNSTGFVVPVALVFLVGLCRRRWGLVAVMVVLAALVKPHFALLAVALFVARQWRWGGIAAGGAVVANLAVYALWPRDFPGTIVQSIHNAAGYGSFRASVSDANASFAKALLAVADGLKGNAVGGAVPDGFLAGPRAWIGNIVLVLVVTSVLALGRRISPVMVGVVLLATASLAPAVSNRYYLVFVLPVAALVVRDPDGPAGSGIFERAAAVGGRRRLIGICVSVAAALSIAQVALPIPPAHVKIFSPTGAVWTVLTMVQSTVLVATLLWLVTCAAVVVSYARKPDPSYRGDLWSDGAGSADVVQGASTTPREGDDARLYV